MTATMVIECRAYSRLRTALALSYMYAHQPMCLWPFAADFLCSLASSSVVLALGKSVHSSDSTGNKGLEDDMLCHLESFSFKGHPE